MSYGISRKSPMRYVDHGPIAPDCWQPGPHSYPHALEVIKDRVKNIEHKRKRHMAEIALFGRLAAHSARSHSGLAEVQQSLDETTLRQYQHVIDGDTKTPDYIRFLHEFPTQNSIEIARLIHPGDWDVREAIDIPVRTALVDPENDLKTQFVASRPHYKIVQFGGTFNMATVDRKRVAMSHFGETILTVIRNSILIDTNHAPDELREYIFKERVAAAKGYDYDQHSEVVHDALEDHMRVREMENKPRWAIPLMTTYYSALKKEIDD